jgi:hypothetical protein
MLYPDDMDLQTRTAVFTRKLVCWYIIAATYTYSAREEMHFETRRQFFSSATTNTTFFRIAMKSIDNPLDGTAKRHLTPKYSFVLLMAFEAAVKLQEWTLLPGIIEEAEAAPCTLRFYECISDLVLRSTESIPDDISLHTMQVALSSGVHLRNCSMR